MPNSRAGSVRSDASATTESWCADWQAELAQVERNTVFVLHMMGNHGPAYFRRYPPEFRRFTPDCATAELRNCSREQVVNAYDNAMLYTDHVLAGRREHAGAAIRGARHRDDLRLRSRRVAGRERPVSAWPAVCHRAGHADARADDRLAVAPASPPAATSTCAACATSRATRSRTTTCSIRCWACWTWRPAAYRPARDIFDGCRGGASRSPWRSRPPWRYTHAESRT